MESWLKQLDMIDQFCWAYEIGPSEYGNRASKTIWYDATFKIRVRVGELSVNHLQQHYSMVKILSDAFGGSDESRERKFASNEQGVAAFNNMFGKK